MNEFLIPKIIQLCGLLIGTGLGTILLNPDVVGSMAHGLNNIFLMFVSSLNKTYVKVSNFSRQEPGTLMAKPMIGNALLVLLGWLLLTIGLIYDTNFIFGLGLFIFLIYTIFGIFLLIRDFLRGKLPLRHRFWLNPIFLIIRLLGVFVFLPATILPIFVFKYLVFLFVFLLNSIAGKDIFKRILIVSGFIIFLAGLIWEIILIA